MVAVASRNCLGEWFVVLVAVLVCVVLVCAALTAVIAAALAAAALFGGMLICGMGCFDCKCENAEEVLEVVGLGFDDGVGGDGFFWASKQLWPPQMTLLKDIISRSLLTPICCVYCLSD